MKIAGIIAEYNPFHNGHLYHIEETRRRTGCDAVIVVMSGDFVQRGVPAFADRYLRAEAALRCGADLVIELPVYGAVASAEDFASAGIRALESLHCVDIVSYGAEDASLGNGIFREAADFLLKEPDDLHERILSYCRKGHSFAKARALALGDVRPDLAALIAKPNNILAVEYERSVLSLNSSMVTCAIPRSDKGYHDTQVSPLCSAAAVRDAVINRGYFPTESVPRELSALYAEITADTAVTADDFSDMLFAELSSHTGESLAGIYDVPAELAERILERAKTPFTWSSLAESVRCRTYTRSRVDRALCHCLLRLTAENADIFRSRLPYLRVLGVRERSSELLSVITAEPDCPILVRFLRDSAALPEQAARFLETDLRASALYSQVLYRKSGRVREDTHRRLLMV